MNRVPLDPSRGAIAISGILARGERLPEPPPSVPCLDCDAPAPRNTRRCDRCLDALLEGLKRRQEAARRCMPLEHFGGVA